jgi:glycerol-3-phosphate dehydrogenase
MKRDILGLVNHKFDLLIIGGGIYGAVLCWRAALAGLSVALVEKDDFGHATSANSQKIIHGGIRYLQSVDIGRTLQSLRERRRLLHLAPHLVHPLACIMPAYGHGLKGIEALSLGLRFYDLIGRHRNRDADPSKFIPAGRILSISETRQLMPQLDPGGLQGAARWYDAYCYNTERLVLAFIKSACRLGTVASNYVKAVRLVPQKDSGILIHARNEINAEPIDIRAENVINCSGPWMDDLLDSSSVRIEREKIKFAVGVNIITRKIFAHDLAVGLRGRRDNESRLYFIVPWRGKSIVGTEWFISDSHPDRLAAAESQCVALINGLNSAYPPAHLTLDDVHHVHAGLVPCKRRTGNGRKNVNLLNHFKIEDHRQEGLNRVVSTLGVKYTTAADVAEKTLKYLFAGVNQTSVASLSQLQGGEIENFAAFQDEMKSKWQSQVTDAETLTQLIFNYGREAEMVLELAAPDSPGHPEARNFSRNLLRGQILFAVRHEMAQKLSDVVLRRTQLGTAGLPSESSLTEASLWMAKEMGWDETKRKSEVAAVQDAYPSFLLSRNLETRRAPERNSDFGNQS